MTNFRDPYRSPRTQARQRAYQEVQDEYYDSRGSGSGAYDDSLLNARGLDDIDNPIEYDPDLRREVFSEMGNAIRASVQEVRKLPADQRTFVEPSRRNSGGRGGPSTIRQAQEEIRAAQRRAKQQYDDEFYSPARGRRLTDDDEDYDDELGDEEDEDDYRDRPQSRRRSPVQRDAYEDLEPEVSSELDDEEDYDPYARRRPVVGQRDDRRRRTQDVRPGPRSPQRPAQQRSRPTDVRRPQSSAPVRRTNNPAPAPRTGRTNGSRERVDQSQTGVRPSAPQFLGPDGRIARNPCGAPLYFDLPVGDELTRVAVICQEERRDNNKPYHPNMPHIARIPDARTNAQTACFIWHYEDEGPRDNR